jgi:hypothetical protein
LISKQAYERSLHVVTDGKIRGRSAAEETTLLDETPRDAVGTQKFECPWIHRAWGSEAGRWQGSLAVGKPSRADIEKQIDECRTVAQ